MKWLQTTDEGRGMSEEWRNPQTKSEHYEKQTLWDKKIIWRCLSMMRLFIALQKE